MGGDIVKHLEQTDGVRTVSVDELGLALAAAIKNTWQPPGREPMA